MSPPTAVLRTYTERIVYNIANCSRRVPVKPIVVPDTDDANVFGRSFRWRNREVVKRRIPVRVVTKTKWNKNWYVPEI